MFSSIENYRFGITSMVCIADESFGMSIREFVLLERKTVQYGRNSAPSLSQKVLSSFAAFFPHLL
jgi:hypothetical protein